MGQQATFTAAASGTPTPTVQWQVSFDGGAVYHNIGGATSTTLSFPTIASHNGYLFRARFTNSAASVTTTIATLTVTSGPSAPVVTQNPSNLTVTVGQQATFTAAASGTPTPTVQWQVSFDGGAVYHNIGGATSTTLSFPTIASHNGYLFRARFTNSVASVTTTIATLTVNAGTPGFMASPLACGDPSCSFVYSQGVYTPGIVNSVLDHSLRQNPSGWWQYGKLSNGGGDGVVVAFNGESADGSPKATDETCIGGTILLKPTPASPDSTALANTSGCGSGYTSYDEHPGYDFRAAVGTPVKAVAAGTILNIGGEYCYKSNISQTCAAWGYVGIDHGNGYVSQYGHLSEIYVVPGQTGITEGQVIGLSGQTAPPPILIGPHLHFEVIRVVNGQPLVVDPYGWVGAGNDPLYSATAAPPTKLWK